MNDEKQAEYQTAVEEFDKATARAADLERRRLTLESEWHGLHDRLRAAGDNVEEIVRLQALDAAYPVAMAWLKDQIGAVTRYRHEQERKRNELAEELREEVE